MENFRCLGLTASGAVGQQFSNLRRAIGNFYWRLAPKMRTDDIDQRRKGLADLRVVVRRKRNSGTEQILGIVGRSEDRFADS
jgi:hypothetical protein